MDRFEGSNEEPDRMYDPESFETGCWARMTAHAFQSCPYGDGWLKQSWEAGWQDTDMSESNEKESSMMSRLEAQVARLRSVIDAIGPYAYKTRQCPPGPEGPRVVFICRICGAKSWSWISGFSHYDGCVLGEHSLPAADTYLDVPECPRCGQDHCQISFFEFRILNLWTHWGMCPETHEPIVCQATPDSAYYVKEPTEGYYYA